jgi:hypothetical protein
MLLSGAAPAYVTVLPCAVPETWAAFKTPNDTTRLSPSRRVTSSGESAKAANETGSATARSVHPPMGAAGEDDDGVGEEDAVLTAGPEDPLGEGEVDEDWYRVETGVDTRGEGVAVGDGVAAVSGAARFPAGPRVVLIGARCEHSVFLANSVVVLPGRPHWRVD